MRIELDTIALAEEILQRIEPEVRRSSSIQPALLSRKDAATYLGISLRLLDRLELPRVGVTDRCFRFRREDLDRFAAERLRA